MKKLKTLFLGLALMLTLATFNSATFTVLAAELQPLSADPQQGGDGSKNPPCYPRCRPVSGPTEIPGPPASPAAPANPAPDSTETTLNEILVFVFTHLMVLP